MGLKLCAALNIYNEIDCLKTTLDSLKDFPLVICNDGKWAHFNDPNSNPEGLSYDGSRELVKSYPNTLLLDSGNKTEEYMTNLLYKTALKQGYDTMLLLAGDEYIGGNLNDFLGNLEVDIYKRPELCIRQVKFIPIHITPEYQNRYTKVTRVFTNLAFVRLRDIHWVFFFNDTRCTPGRVIDGITIYHDDSPRKRTREEQMRLYQDWNVPREQALCLAENKKPADPTKGEFKHPCGCLQYNGEWINVCSNHAGQRDYK